MQQVLHHVTAGTWADSKAHVAHDTGLAKASWYVCEGLPRGIIKILLSPWQAQLLPRGTKGSHLLAPAATRPHFLFELASSPVPCWWHWLRRGQDLSPRGFRWNCQVRGRSTDTAAPVGEHGARRRAKAVEVAVTFIFTLGQ